MSDKWAVIRVPAALLERLDRIGLRLERAVMAGQTVLPVSDRYGLTTATVIERLVRHYESWRRRKEL